MPKQKFEVELDVPEGYEVIDYRQVHSDEWFIGLNGNARVWQFVSDSKDPTFILRKVPKYRDPALPGDWGKDAEFSDDGKEWTKGRIAGYAAHYADDKSRWGKLGAPDWYKFCQILDEQ